jgi:hypothetical protein
VSALAGFCFRRFGWNPRELHKKFESCVWAGVCLNMLMRVSFR